MLYNPNSFYARQAHLHSAWKTIGIVSAVTAVASLAAGVCFWIRASRCMHELDTSLPVLGKAAEKYLHEQQDVSPADDEF